MPLIALADKRHPYVEHRRLPLSERQHKIQISRGLFTTERGEPLAFPVDRLDEPAVFLNRELWRRDPVYGTHRPGVVFKPAYSRWRQRALGWLRDHVDQRIPAAYYHAVLGHDLHIAIFANLYGIHWHRGWVDPFLERQVEPLDHTFETAPWHPGHVARREGEPVAEWRLRAKMLNWGRYGGFAENLGLLSGGLVTTTFNAETVDELVSATATEFADFDFHGVGTNAAVENNTHTDLQTDSGIARATGTPVDENPSYANDATITADATETWEEEGIFNNLTGVAMMDRNLTGGQAVNASDQVTYQYTLTLNPET